ncbi:dicarboxylate carrier SLC25A8-like isoform X2 [Bacillus rossius redtenbacheri]|uniref:dicarboxylate carrier SLC25A8-like isoform X2 n=1 Tax=Bacillus rossius redtenbacheri TaxID=93214 RepID=UPI002FDCCBDE
MKMEKDLPLGYTALTAGVSACVADLVTFPLDTAKVRLQIQGEGRPLVTIAHDNALLLRGYSPKYQGVVGTITTIARQEGAKSLYNGLSAGLQRQMCFASVRLGFYDSFKNIYLRLLDGEKKVNGGVHVAACVASGITTGALCVLIAQPTDVVKVRFQAQQRTTSGVKRYTSTMQAYRLIGREEGIAGLWKGTFPNVGRNAIINVSEIVCYDIIKNMILSHRLMDDSIPCHFTSAVFAGLCSTVMASPVDVVKTRYMNSAPGEYKGAIECAVRMFTQEGAQSFYKGFVPSFYRLVSWNVVLWITYEQLKRSVSYAYTEHVG